MQRDGKKISALSFTVRLHPAVFLYRNSLYANPQSNLDRDVLLICVRWRRSEVLNISAAEVWSDVRNNCAVFNVCCRNCVKTYVTAVLVSNFAAKNGFVKYYCKYNQDHKALLRKYYLQSQTLWFLKYLTIPLKSNNLSLNDHKRVF